MNQLQYILEIFKTGNYRRSALHASILDPTREDTNSRQQGFPCPQQVEFSVVENAGLSVTGFYPLQYLFTKAHGNYLSLCRLGRFIVVQVGLSMIQGNCMSANAKLAASSKSELKGLARDPRQLSNDLKDDS